MDHVLRPFQDRLVAAVAGRSDQKVLDVGCGTGAVALAIARGRPAATVTGVDISAPMLTVAQTQAHAAGLDIHFLLADAENHDFPADGFDMVVSRFGVMFFSRPVTAFTNLRRATRPGGRLCFFAWRSVAENLFMSLAEKAAAPFLPPLPPRQPDAPGQFAFARRDHVLEILGVSGWNNIDIAPADMECRLPAAWLPTYLSRFGPLGRAMQGLAPERHQEVMAHLLAAFAPFIQADEVCFTAACWEVNAIA